MGEISKEEVNWTIYQKTTLITHVRCRDAHSAQAISVDLTVSSEKWEFHLFSRGFSDYKFTDASDAAWAEFSPKLEAMLGSQFQLQSNGNMKAEFEANLTPSAMALRLADVVMKVREALGYNQLPART